MQRKKVLIVTYAWPPSGGSGAQRWLKFVKYLPDFGWDPIIVTPENPQFIVQDTAFVKEVQSMKIKVIKIPIWEPYGLFKKLSQYMCQTKAFTDPSTMADKQKNCFNQLACWIRGNMFIPDAKIFWIKPATKKIIKIIQAQSVDVMVTTGPPHSLHLIGWRIKKALPWLADFRDPWSTWDMLQYFRLTPLAKYWHQCLEKKVLTKADKVLTVSKSWQADLQKTAGNKVAVVTNGFDEADFINYKGDGYCFSQFSISHMGLLNGFRNLSVFWQVLAACCKEDTDFHNTLIVNLIGQITPEIKQDIPATVASKVRLVPYLPHAQIIQAYEHSTVLLLIQNQSHNIQGHIPGKFFEYLGAKKPILLLGNEKSELADLIQYLKCGVVCNWQDKVGIRQALKKLFQDHRQGKKLPVANIKAFTRKNLTRQLAKLLDEMHNDQLIKNG